MRHLFIVPLLFCCTACVSGIAINEPPLMHEGQLATVRAHDQNNLERLQTFVDDLEPKVRKLMRSEAPPPVVWLLDVEKVGTARGGYATRNIWPFREQIIVLGTLADDKALAHELAHWHSANSGHAKLPHFVEEGLAEFIAEEILPPSLPTEVPDDIDWQALLALDSETRLKITEVSEIVFFYAMGVEFIRLIGLEELLDMREQGRTSVDELTLAAGL